MEILHHLKSLSLYLVSQFKLFIVEICDCLDRFIPIHSDLERATVNVTFSPFFSISMLLTYMKATDMHMLRFCPEILMSAY